MPDPQHPFTYLHLFPPNPYPVNLPPPSIAHKVWILDCKTCGSFLTNRAMKAVLLLRPNVSLYSSDVLPANCSAYSSNPEVVQTPLASKAHGSSRTCECLTQSLCCHTCGTAVGYMIVVPCTRCTSSVSASNRVTNGHRFVFHSSEVSGTERHYVRGEPGVIPFGPCIFVPPPPSAAPTPQHVPYPSPPFSPYPHYNQRPSRSRSSSPPVFRSDYLPTPPLEFAVPEYASSRYNSPEPDSPYSFRVDASVLSPPSVAPVTSNRYPLPRRPHNDSLTEGSSPSLLSPSQYPADQKESLVPSHTLKAGDVVFWHHLARSGEIPGVTDDERARRPASKGSREIFFNR
ncbi:hypothetical protein CVT26_006617 [Gymnopilus dilepis]|uniref:Uncharacterized protein n=1 Tax=Gymnopilus dilepis TaxID=231916 RepID=A0A409Y331_9AGAR|nr:hypothetical protein CVT26_006617 [Gymnopilus dilepis]